MQMAVEGIRVVELGYYAQIPQASLSLAQFGAEVIKIEQPGTGDPSRGAVTYGGVPAALKGGRSYLYESMNFNKKSVVIDLQTEDGKAILYRLVAKSDVFMTNMRQGAVKKLGIDYETLSQHNRRLIYVASSGYGSRGADADGIAIDTDGAARAGRMIAQVRAGMVPLLDLSAPVDVMGAMMAAYGIMLALRARDKYGTGQVVNISLIAAGLNMERAQLNAVLFTGKEFERQDRDAPRNPMWNAYKCRDNRWLCLTQFHQPDKYWPILCEALGRTDLAQDTRFNNYLQREKNARELVGILDQAFAANDCAEWTKRLKARGIGVSPVNTAAEACNDPQVLANDYIVDFDHPTLGRIKCLSPLIELSKTPGKIMNAAPELGQHTEEVLLDIGYSWDEIALFKDRGVI